MYKREMLALLQKFNAQIEPLSMFTTFGIGGNAIVVLPHALDELEGCLSVLETNKIRFKVIGNGSNLLAPSRRTNLVIVCTKNLTQEPLQVKEIDGNQCLVKVSSGINLNQFIMWCAERGLEGLENLYGIPATVGGAVVMNAGAFEVSIFDHLKALTVYEIGEVKTLKACEIEVGEHTSELLHSGKIVLEAEFVMSYGSKENILARIKEISRKRLEKQPQGKSAGSVFKNPKVEPAGKLIDRAGLKGLRLGKAYVSKKHANFILSDGATDRQVKKLIAKIQKIVKRKFGIYLEREIEYIGEDDENHRRLSHSHKIQQK
ncbi:MAG: UDP-N-acetylmuramate dehydrogenase [Clostridia bacterium]|nr:UDP-N-acetylmuramate dehydrogenase [Clostridia bacterium]